MKILIFLIAVFALSCSKIETNQTSNPAGLKLADVTAKLKAENLPVIKETIYDEATDPNHLLKRPNQYIEKMNFTDSRIKSDKLNCSIEVFSNTEDLQKRKSYIESVTKSASMFAEYTFAHKNVLLRIDKELTPTDADKYKIALELL